MVSIIIGIAAGVFCYTALGAKERFGYDDSLDAFGVHGVGGTVGTLGAGLFASLAINSSGADGLFYGNTNQFFVQLIGVGVAALYSFVVSMVILKVIDLTVGLRLPEKDEIQGLDVTQHGEEGYFF
jgi:Amt family ammonium transporter